MRKVEFKYFIDGEQVNPEDINWEDTLGVDICGDEIDVLFPHNFNGLGFDDYKDQAETAAITQCYATDYVGCRAQQAITSCGIIEGVKHNSYKAPLDIVINRQFPKALQMVSLATAFGNKKYEATDKDFLNFKRVKGGSQTYFDACARHNAERNEVDSDSNLPHGIHAVWNMLAALELVIEEENVDVKEFSKMYLESLHISK